MTSQFMVRVLRNDDEYADVVVDAEDEENAKSIALSIVKRDPQSWFSDPPFPTYCVDPSSDVEELDGGEYISANEVRP